MPSVYSGREAVVFRAGIL